MAVKLSLQRETDQQKAAATIRALYARTVPSGRRRGNWREVANLLGENVGTTHAYAHGKRHIPRKVLVRLGVVRIPPKTLWQMSRSEIKDAFEHRR